MKQAEYAAGAEGLSRVNVLPARSLESSMKRNVAMQLRGDMTEGGVNTERRI